MGNLLFLFWAHSLLQCSKALRQRWTFLGIHSSKLHCEMSSLVEVKPLLLRPANQTLGIDRRGAAGRLHSDWPFWKVKFFLESKTNLALDWKFTTNVKANLFSVNSDLSGQSVWKPGLFEQIQFQIGIQASGCLPRIRWGQCWTSWWAPKETVSHKIPQAGGYPTFQDECSLQTN